MKGVQKNQGKQNLAEAAILAKRVATDFQKLVEDIEGIELDAWTEQGPLDTFKLVDELNGIKYTLNALTDGRPQPIDYSNAVPDPAKEGWEKVSAEIKEELRSERRRWREWAHCDSPGYEEKAMIGGKSFNMAELRRLRDWIDAVVKWHEKNPKKINGESV